jgi:FkbM family methyltransferase
MIERSGWFFPDNDIHFEKYVLEFPNTQYQQKSIDLAYDYVKNFNNAIDIGANIGLHTVRFAQKFKSVFSFEPVTSVHECLKKNISKFNNVENYKVGLGENNTHKIISIPKNNTNCGQYSIVDFTNFQNELIDEKIEIKCLDDFNLTADLIKIDTQGYELPILRGSIETLKKNFPVLILELENKKDLKEVELLLNPLGYILVKSNKHDIIWARE